MAGTVATAYLNNSYMIKTQTMYQKLKPAFQKLKIFFDINIFLSLIFLPIFVITFLFTEVLKVSETLYNQRT